MERAFQNEQHRTYSGSRSHIVLDNYGSFRTGMDDRSLVEGSQFVYQKPKPTKQIWLPVGSAGSVSSVTNTSNGYVRDTSLKNVSYTEVQPMELNSKANVRDTPLNNESLLDNNVRKDTEETLCKMLVGGFHLDRNGRQDVLGRCGYDMPKFVHSPPKIESHSSERELHNVEGNTEKETLAACFPKKEDESPKKYVAQRHATIEPLKEPVGESYDSVAYSLQKNESGVDEDDEYQLLREAVTQHRATMREYYKAAASASAEGDHDRASKLLKEAKFFCEKANEADDKSYDMIVKKRHKDEILVDLHDHGVREARRLLKCHLSSLAGIPSYLKVIIEKDGEDASKGARRRSITKLLERESIGWSEQDPETIIIDLCKIKRENLSFAEKAR